MISPQLRQEAANELLRRRAARKRLSAFCQYVHPGYIQAPHLSILSECLERVVEGDISRLIITMPPRHGKSLTASILFPAWYLARYPERRIIITSYSSGLSRRFSRSARNIWMYSSFKRLFPNLGISQSSKAADAWDIDVHGGGLLSAGVGGGITGHGADLLIIDDPIKDDAEASSALVRENLWDWYTTTAYTRLQPRGAILIIATRWPQDDLIGKVIQQGYGYIKGDAWHILHFPAIWEQGIERFHDEWRQYGHHIIDVERKEGQALWPERYSADKLYAIRGNIGSMAWNCLFQGIPTEPEGLLFQRSWFKFVDASPSVGKRVRYWDKAGTPGSGSYTVGVLMCRTPDGLYYVEDVVRGQWTDYERESVIRSTAEIDRSSRGHVQIYIEQEPGSGGLDSAKATIRNLAGFSVYADKPTGDKALRARPLAAQMEAGNVFIVKAPWNAAYVDELSLFPKGRYADQVDASSGAFNVLADAKTLKLGFL